MTPANETPNDLAEVDRHFIYTCSTCGKNTPIEKVQSSTSRWVDWDARSIEETDGLRAFHESRGLAQTVAGVHEPLRNGAYVYYQSVELHFSGCVRIGMPTYW